MELAIEQEKYDRMVACPYCFKKFMPKLAYFKSTKSYSKNEVDSYEKDMMSELNPADDDYEVKKSNLEEKVRKRRYLIDKKDESLEQFWAAFPGSEYNQEYKNRAIFASKKLTGVGYENGLEYESGHIVNDSDGFPMELQFDNEMSTKVRVCPHCHNILPFEFGKHNIKYIAVVGITSSGKTVYLSQLFKKIKNYLTVMGLTMVGSHNEIDKFIENYGIAMNTPLPGPSPAHSLTPPMPITVINQKSGEKTTLVFYDIAGENCVDPDNMDMYGKFVINADAIMMIIDPKQFADSFNLQGFDSDSDAKVKKKVYEPATVLDTMYNAFLAQHSEQGRSMIPLAVAFSKSDMLFNVVDSNSNITRNINYNSYVGSGFARKEQVNISTELERKLNGQAGSDGTTFVRTIKAMFTDYSFFAFSALNGNAVTQIDGEEKVKIVTKEPNPLRIEEAIAWLFWKMGLIDEIYRYGEKEEEHKKGFSLFGRRK